MSVASSPRAPNLGVKLCWMRTDYGKAILDERDVGDDPIALLERWLHEAELEGEVEPTAMCLATADADARPSARFVLLRGLDAQGLTFFTNYLSRKGGEIGTNRWAAAAFWWPNLERQVRVEGSVSKVSREESDAYFESRPLESRIASAGSPQSQPVASRAALEALVSEVGPNPKRPEHWGGYRLSPVRIEFWQGRPARLHDRIVFELDVDGAWRSKRLAP